MYSSDTTESQEKYCGHLLKVMKKIETLRLIISLFVGLSFLATIILSYWSSPFKLRRLDGNYTGKKTLHLLASAENAQRILISIRVKFCDMNCHIIIN